MRPDTRAHCIQIARDHKNNISLISIFRNQFDTSQSSKIYWFFVFTFILNSLFACRLPQLAEPPSPQFPSEQNTPDAGLVWVPYGSPTLTPFLPKPRTPVPSIPPYPTTRNETNAPQNPSSKSIPEFTQLSSNPDEIPTILPQISSKEHINILLLGSDRRSSASFRTDTLIILSLRPKERLVTLISIPRDLYVDIPGWKTNRINTAFLHGELEKYRGGGSALLKETIKHNLGIQIHHLAIVEFDGFRQIIDTMEGIDVALACEFTEWHVISADKSLHDPNNWKLRTIGPGLVHMDGDMALWYVRARLRSNDFDRGRRQQEVLRAIFSRGIELDLVSKIPKLFKSLRGTFYTDLDLDDIIALAPLALDMNAAYIRSYYINKEYTISWRTPQGASVLLPKKDKIKDLVAEAMNPPDEGEADHLATLIEIVNATSNKEWGFLASERLNYAGYQSYVSQDDSQETSETILYDLTPEQDPSKRADLLNLLGLASSRTLIQPSKQSEISYRLVLGTDYNPCFNPFKIIR